MRLRRCLACGAILADSDSFCGECGSDAALPAAPTKPPTAQKEESPKVARLVRAAHVMRTRGKLDEALRLCRQASLLDPQSVMARALLSELLHEKGDLVKAVEQVMVTANLADQAQGVRGALEQARRTRAEIEAAVVGQVLNPEERRPWDLKRLLSEGERNRRVSRHLNLALIIAGGLGHFIAFIALTRLNLLALLWFGITAFAAYWVWRKEGKQKQTASEQFWQRLTLATGPFGIIVYLLNHD